MRNEAFAKDAAAQQALYDKIEEMILNYKKSGILNDALFAQNKVASLRRKGKSVSIIVNTLKEKGIKKEAVVDALRAYDVGLGFESSDDAEYAAALTFAKRKKFDVKAQSLLHELDSGENEGLRKKYIDLRRKALASLARGGYSSGVARKVVEALM